MTEPQRAAVRFNPTVVVSYGCYLYPAVNALGQISKGLQNSGWPSGMCKGSGHGTQVYGRSTWIKGKFAIMYAYFSPKQQTTHGQNHRYGRDYAIVWLATPKAMTFLAVAVGWNEMSYKFKPGEKVGESVKIEFGHHGGDRLILGISEKEGGKRLPLIMWEQLPFAARCSLNHARWIYDKEKMPLSDERFQHLLNKAWPF
uniref:Nep1-like protein n=1 Tax=Hyaloperonospora arabidopsidis (strain Emoy2) TaxID=559515 RepID=M4BKV0_HYAAE